MSAAMSMLDETHENLPQSAGDSNTYVLGSIARHDVVLACLPEMGIAPAASVTQQMKRTFPDLRCALLVGIGGAIPRPGHDIRLGDVVVGVPGAKLGAVVQWDYGKTVAEGQFVHRGTMNDPPAVLLTAVNALRARYNLGQTRMAEHLDRGYQALAPNVRGVFQRPIPEDDVLFRPDYDYEHVDGRGCQTCDQTKAEPRENRPESMQPPNVVHFGTIASGNQVVKHAGTRDEIGAAFDALCLEMEAAGIVRDIPCIVIRGICDYSDCHKNKKWQGHAAMAAAAFAKDLLEVVPSSKVNEELDPGYLFHGEPPLRTSAMSLKHMARGEGRYWQDYWHVSRVLHAGPSVFDDDDGEYYLKRMVQAEQRKEELGRALGRPPELPPGSNPTMETMLSDFMHTYHSALLAEGEAFREPSQQHAVFTLMLRLTKGKLDRDGDTGRTLLHYMSMNGVSDLLPKLVALGFDVNASDSDYQTPLHLAVIGNHFEAVEVLVNECHADVHIRDLNNLLPWHHALHIGWDTLVVVNGRRDSRARIIRLLATVTDEASVKGDSRTLLRQLKLNPDGEVAYTVF